MIKLDVEWHRADLRLLAPRWQGPRRSARSVSVLPWAAIRRNYPRSVLPALDALMAVSVDRLPGRLLLLHGPPGTGKTTLLRSLGHAWSDWCRFDYVVDREGLLHDAGYLNVVLLGDEDDAPGWRLLILEDCDELVRVDAKANIGHALARLLNLTDGLLGHGLTVLVCITTNEDLARVHPAVNRPGRCLAHIHMDRLPPEEAAAWLGERAHHPEGATIAELYAGVPDHQPIRHGTQPAPIGQYL